MVTVCPWWSVCPREDPFPPSNRSRGRSIRQARFVFFFLTGLTAGCAVFSQSGAAAPGALRHHVTLRLKGGAVIGLFQSWRLYSPFSAAQEAEVNREFTATGYKAGGSLLT